MKNNITIWCTYHQENQLKEYNLKDSQILKLFYSNDLTLNEDNINYLNTMMSELVTYYYIWKNQLKSDYIGLCHYRRYFQTIEYEHIDNIHIQSYFSWDGDLENFDFCLNFSNININKISEMYKKYFLEKYNYDINKHKKDVIIISSNLSYIMTWDVFNDVCDFIFGFFDYVSKLLNVNWKNENDLLSILSYFSIVTNNDTVNIHNRYLSVLGEYLIGLYIGIFYKPMNWNNDFHKNTIVYHIKDKEQLFKMYKLNVKTGTWNIVNICNIKNFEYDDYVYKLLHLVNDTKEDIEIFNKEMSNSNMIILKDNEYIDCEDSFEFTKGNYTIKTI